MAKQKVVREITIEVCDFCQLECTQGSNISRCGLCKRIGHGTHMVYAVGVYRYQDHARMEGFGHHVCSDCATSNLERTPKMIFDRILESE
jgi:hypothetical protein